MNTPEKLSELTGSKHFNYWQHRAETAEAALKVAREALTTTRALVSEGAMHGFTEPEWADRLFKNQALLTKALSALQLPPEGDANA